MTSGSTPSYEEIELGLRRGWFPVASVQQLDSPQRADLLGESLVVFRDGDGRAAVTGRRCVHRGGDLSLGRIVDGSIECPYHGWRYGGDGVCSAIPSLEDPSKIPANARVPSYPAVERFGLVWTCLGDPVTDPPELPELDDLEIEYRATAPFDTQAGLLHALENFRDVAHFPFVHRQSMGEVATTVPALEVRSEGFETWMRHDFSASAGANELYHDKEHVVMDYHAVAPSLATNLLDHGEGGHRVVIEAFCPISARGGCRIWVVSGTAKDYTASTPEEALEAEFTVVSEDMLMLESVSPPEVPLHNEAPHASVPADRYTMASRHAYLAFIRHALDSDRATNGAVATNQAASTQ
ncbi:MAG: Rieske 2Fe-2S domain-containing protein [Gemmatimonas sp.]|nr:Rieske 2Fe-2S domain-containing protein [Gemmatimonas sp.]